MSDKLHTKKVPLGQGLSALLGYSDHADDNSERELKKLHLNQISVRVGQPRKIFSDTEMESLINSVKEKGILQPIIVRPLTDSTFEIIAGERRWRAAKTLGMLTIPAITLDVSDVEAHEISIIENVQRHDLNPLEEAEAYFSLMEKYKYTQEKIASVVGKSRSHIANSLRLLNLDPLVKEKLINGLISPGHARALLGTGKTSEILDAVITGTLSVRETENLVKSKDSYKNPFKDDSLSAQAAELAAKVSEQLTLPVRINLRRDGGQVIISFYSYEQMDQLLEKLRGNN